MSHEMTAAERIEYLRGQIPAFVTALATLGVDVRKVVDAKVRRLTQEALERLLDRQDSVAWAQHPRARYRATFSPYERGQFLVDTAMAHGQLCRREDREAFWKSWQENDGVGVLMEPSTSGVKLTLYRPPHAPTAAYDLIQAAEQRLDNVAVAGGAMSIPARMNRLKRVIRGFDAALKDVRKPLEPNSVASLEVKPLDAAALEQPMAENEYIVWGLPSHPMYFYPGYRGHTVADAATNGALVLMKDAQRAEYWRRWESDGGCAILVRNYPGPYHLTVFQPQPGTFERIKDVVARFGAAAIAEDE